MALIATRRVVLTSRPQGPPSPECFDLVAGELEAPAKGHVVVAVEHLSVDAFIRTTLDEGSFHATVPIGGTVAALGVGRVIASAADELEGGDVVFGPLGAQTHCLGPAAMFRKLDVSRVPARAYLGVLGLTTGITAHVGMVTVGEVAAGETVVVSAAAGAVGSVAVQIARQLGARVIGIAGGPDKGRYVTGELKAAAAIDYKAEDVGARLSELAPDGVDVFFDNVGGELLDTVLDRIAPRARVVICGAISQYQRSGDVRGPSLYLRLAERNASMRGFTVTFHADAHEAAERQLTDWYRAGELRLAEHVIPGLERFPEALDTLLTGGHTGKLLVAVQPDAT